MGNLCTQCLHYRSPRPRTQLLIRDLGADEGQLVTELTRMMQEEVQKQDAEASQLRQLVREEERAWRIQPKMTSYCGLHEAKDVYYIAELKNPRGDCTDYRNAEPPRACSTCKHRVPGGGPARDTDHIAKLNHVGANAAALGQPGGLSLLDEYKNYIAMSKTLEAVQAFYAGKLTHRPGYLSICRKHSEATSFVPCAVQNPHDVCSDWSEITPPQSASPAAGWGLIGSRAKRAKGVV